MDSTSFSILMILITAVAGIMLLSGHGEIFMRGGNADLRNKLYDQKKFERACGVALLLAALATVADMFTTTLAAKIIYIVVIVVIIAGVVIYIKKRCRK